jgi:hypothetical protein
VGIRIFLYGMRCHWMQAPDLKSSNSFGVSTFDEICPHFDMIAYSKRAQELGLLVCGNEPRTPMVTDTHSRLAICK